MRYLLLILFFTIQAFSFGANTYELKENCFKKVLTLEKSAVEDCRFIPFRYQGQYEDEETGLYYNRFRYYSPDTGAYISQDPIGLNSGEPNFYAYVDDSNGWVDVFGLSGIPEGAIRRPSTHSGDANFPSARASRRAAMRSKNIPTSQSYESRIRKLPKNAKGNVLHVEEIYDANKTKLGEIDLHKDGHLFDDVKPNTYEPPHYHGKDGAHLTYEGKSPKSTNNKFKYHH